MKFKVGDRALIVKSTRNISVGKECVIVGPSHMAGFLYVDCDFLGPSPLHPHWSARPEWLRPIYNGDEKVSWSDCEWKPTEVTV